MLTFRLGQSNFPPTILPPRKLLWQPTPVRLATRSMGQLLPLVYDEFRRLAALSRRARRAYSAKHGAGSRSSTARLHSMSGNAGWWSCVSLLAFRLMKLHK